jgi:glycogen debranching enzyme
LIIYVSCKLLADNISQLGVVAVKYKTDITKVALEHLAKVSYRGSIPHICCSGGRGGDTMRVDTIWWICELEIGEKKVSFITIFL